MPHAPREPPGKASCFRHVAQSHLSRPIEAGRGVEHPWLQSRKVVNVSLAARRRYAAEGLRSTLLRVFHDRDQLGLLKNLQVPAQIAVRKRAESLQIHERQTSGMRDQ